MRFRHAFSVLPLALVAACALSTEADTETSESAFTAAPVIVPGPLVNAEDVFRCDDVEGTVYAKNVAAVKSAVAFAARTRRSLKVTSARRGGHSANPILCPASGGLVINVAELRDIRIDEARRIVSVGPGATLDELSTALGLRGLAIETMPDYTGMTVAGAVATGAHGSSLRIQSALAAHVVGMSVVDGTGARVELDGDKARTAAAHGGWLGALVELRLRVVPQFKVAYGQESRSDARLAEEAVARVSAHDYGRIHWFPENGRAIYDWFDKRAVSAPGDAYDNAWDKSSPFSKIIGDLASKVINGAPTEDAQCLASAVRSATWSASFAGAPLFREAVGFSHRMMGGTCAEGSCGWEGGNGTKVRSVEIAFPLSQLTPWIADVRSILARSRACFPVFGMYLRFSKGSDVALDMSEGADTVLFEIHVLESGDDNRIDMSSPTYDEIQQMTLTKYRGRPHWGKNESPVFVGVGPRAYPRFGQFTALRDTLDPRGLFKNALWDQTANGAPVAHAPGCAIDRSCICASDSDCGSGRTCTPGFAFADARVCRKSKWEGCLRGHECASHNCTLFHCL